MILMEVGMGGDLDATNIISTTVLSILVSISMDHTAFLEIPHRRDQQKKAGIIKPNSHMVTVKQQPEAGGHTKNMHRTECATYEGSRPGTAQRYWKHP